MNLFSIRNLLCVWLVLLLSACASTFTSQVSSFHEWPANFEKKTYLFERAPEQENQPEHKHYEAELAQQLSKLGFVAASDGSQAQLKISLRYASGIKDFELSPLSPYWNPYFYDPYWRYHFRRGWYYRYPAWPGGLPGRGVAAVNASYLHQLEIKFSELSSGKTLADIRASTEQSNQEISLFLPDLISAALSDFPGVSGKTRQVTLSEKTPADKTTK